MRKALLAGFAACAAVFVAVLTSGQSSAGIDQPFADNSLVDSATGQEACSQGSP